MIPFKRLLPALCLLLSSLMASAADGPLWLRYPAISPDGKTIAFTYRGNLYKVSSAGGTATPLTMDGTNNCMPVWSRDGSSIAFAGNQAGNFDVYLIPSAGGEARRLTWHSADEFPYDFSVDKGVIFGAVRLDDPENRQFPSDALQELYQVPVSGGRVQQLLTTPAEDAKMSADGRFIIYHDRKGRENIWRKHQTSSIARDVWVYDSRTKSHRKLSPFVGEDRNPVWAGSDNFFYLSEKNGSFNVYRSSLSGNNEPQQVTFLKDHPVRFLSMGNGVLCFGYNGEIYVKTQDGNPVKVSVDISAAEKNDDETHVPFSDITEMTVSPSGKEIAFIMRGEVFAGSTEGNMIKRITRTPGAEAGLSFSPDGQRLLYAGERNGRWNIYQSEMIHPEERFFFNASSLKETTIINNDHENYQPQFSPDGKMIAFVEDRTTLKILNVASRQARTIAGPDQLYSRNDHDQYFEWSPDSRWLLIKYNGGGNGNDEVGIISATGNGKPVNLTRSGYSDSNPQWMMDGRMMIWQTDRNGLHSYANSSTRQDDVYALFFDRDLWKNFNLSKDEAALQKGLNTKSPQPAAAKETDIDWEGLELRKTRLTTHPSLLSSAVVSKEGETLYYLAKFERNYDLWSCNLRTKETKILLPLNISGASMQWDKDKKYIYLLAGGKVLRIDPAASKKESLSFSGEMAVNTAGERKEMFEHVWRRTKETFYTAGLHGVNWDALKTNYEKFLPYINNNYDFAELLNELLGELNVSHTGASFDDEMKDGDVTASLGVFYDLTYKGPGMAIKEVMKGGRLDDPAFKVTPGTVIEMIDGEKVSADKDFAAYLDRKAGKKILLGLREGNSTRQIQVKPVTPEKEFDLLYERWIKRNEAETDKLSNGQLGYVHLYRMNDGAYRRTYEEVLGKFPGRKGMVVDTRFNRGGDLASELIMFLSGKKIRENTTDRFLVYSEPAFRWTKPSIVLACEANYSDGHCFVHDYQVLKMGKLVGMPVPGSCTWMTGQTLHDNAMHFSVPTLGVKDLEGRYLENSQTQPDIEVMNTYDTVAAGRDQQLEAAIRALMKDINANR
ncbi:S41 family peptidase [Chitinophaga barathri]|uniref:Tricorn protease homolog n=1 Tax=Chitinophaga barathri TaxID=1647451 RepID=A0A3N4MMN8_9BACT|nr:S41 family peptidase [Chitinophaga barathri]RPD40869.1 peptidase S41 [Chitinophaga barathri]